MSEALEIRRQLQAEFPEYFRPCSACPPEGPCVECWDTGRVTIATAHLLSEGRLPEEEAA